MLDRFNNIAELPVEECEALLLNVDAFLRNAETRRAYQEKQV